MAYIQPIPNEFCGDVKSMENASRISRFRSKKTKLDPKAKKPCDCSEEELVKFYGEVGEPKDVRTAEDLDQYPRTLERDIQIMQELSKNIIILITLNDIISR
jgi:hypothetical protein